MRRLLLMTLVLTLFAAACGEDSPVVGPPDGAPDVEITETSLDECVIDVGEIAPAEPTGEDVTTITDGVLTVGSDTAYPPFEFIEGDQVVGFDIDLIREIAQRLGDGLEIEVVSADFDTIFTALAAGRFDVVISAVTITGERKQTVDFTDPYFHADQSLAVREEDAGEIEGVEDLEGRTVGVQRGTTGEDCARNALEEPGLVAEVRSFETVVDAFTDLSAGGVDAILNDFPTSKRVVEQRRGLAIVQMIRTQERYGIAVSKDNPNLRVAINDALDEIRTDGTYRELFLKWFETEPPEED